MMSHSHQHPQPQQRLLLSQCLNQLHEHPAESSFSSSQTHYKTKIPLCLIHSETTSTPTHSFFGPKIVSSSPHQHYYFHEPHSPSSFPCCFNVSSRRWSAFKLGCTSMDPQVELSASLHSPSEIIRKRKITGRQKREELEKEVAMLQRLLDQEEKFHEILEMVHNRPNGSSISIPNFLPPKMRELLGELVMIEGEIARLESQISQLQDGLKREQEITMESKPKTWNQGNLTNSNNHLSTSPVPNPSPICRIFQERMAFET